MAHHSYSDLVLDSRLDTALASGITHHVIIVPNPAARQGRLRVQESWSQQKLLGRGGFGQVWLEACVSGPSKGGFRAVKEIAKLESKIDYNRELEAITKFSHRKYVHCFVQSYGWYDTDRAVFIAMEYIQHGDLRQFMTNPLSEDDTRDIGSQLTEGLSLMHRNNFAHRDLKPANIMVVNPGPNWWVKITDFGISKRAREGSTELRTQIGTPGFIAPEVLGFRRKEDSLMDEKLSYTLAVDIWALGEILYRMVVGFPPFPNAGALSDFALFDGSFPKEPLLARNLTLAGFDFLKAAMAPTPRLRPSADELLMSPWLKDLPDRLGEMNLSSSTSAEWPNAADANVGGSTALLVSSMQPRVEDVPDTATAPWTTKAFTTTNFSKSELSEPDSTGTELKAIADAASRRGTPISAPRGSPLSDGATVRGNPPATNHPRPQSRNIEPPLSGKSALERAKLFKEQGNEAVAAKQYKDAIASYTLALELDPSNSVYLANRSAAFTLIGQHNDAYKDARAATVFDRSYAKGWSRLGLTRYRLGDVKGSLAAYEEALKLEKDGGSNATWRNYERVRRQYTGLDSHGPYFGYNYSS